MATITATAIPAKGIVRIDVDFATETAPAVYISRVNELTGEATPVRTHGTPVTVSGYAAQGIQAGYRGTVYDTECPRDTPVHYVAYTVAQILTIRPTFTAQYLDPWTAANSASLVPGLGFTTGRSMFLYGDGVTANPQAVSEYVAVIPLLSAITARVTAYNSLATAQTVSTRISWYTSALALISTVFDDSVSIPPLATRTLGLTNTAPATAAYARLRVEWTATPAVTVPMVIQSAYLASQLGTVVSATLVLPNLSTFWLRDPLRPANDVRVDLCFDPNPACLPAEGIFFGSMDTEGFAARSGQYDVANQREPVTVGRPRGSRTSSLRLVTRTFADRDRVLRLLEPGTPLLWQSPPAYGIPDAYISVGDVSVDRMVPDHSFQPRVITLPFVVEQAPGGGAQGVYGSRWTDQCAITWAAITAAGYTWQQLTQGVAGGP